MRNGINFTIEQLRHDISSKIHNKENEILHHVLYFGEDHEILPPIIWQELMSNEYDLVHCDLPFVQLAANHLQRNIYLLPLYKNKQSKDENIFIKVSSHSWYAGEVEAFYMVYFPEENHYQSIVKIAKDQSLRETFLDLSQNENISEESEDEETDNLFSINNDFSNDEVGKKRKKEKFNAFNLTTCLTEEDPSLTMVVNETSKQITKKLKRGKAQIHKIAPGEGKVSFNTYCLKRL